MKQSVTSTAEEIYWPRFGGGYRLVRWLVKTIFPPVFRLLYGWRITGKENLAGLDSAITLCNHVHTLDCVMMAIAMQHKDMLVLSLPENLHKAFVGGIVRTAGAVAVPQSPAEYRTFYRKASADLAAGRFLHIYPEGWLEPGCRTLRQFHPGAFQMALRFGVPVVPCVLRHYLRKNGKEGLELCILPPLAADPALTKRQAAADLEARARSAMEAAIRETGC